MQVSQTSLDDFVTCVRRSQLVTPERLSQLLEDLRRDYEPEQQTPAYLSALMMQQGLLTPWQVENLNAGKYTGFHLGKYVLLSKIGQGGMGCVFAARHSLMNRRVAIKVLPKSRVEKLTYLERFLREAQAIAQLNHPNIVRVFTVDNQGPLYYMVLEYLEGSNLEQLVRRDGPLPYDLAASYIRQTADGLAHAHSQGLIHRDVKPANLLIEPSGSLKILDLGLARLSSPDQPGLTVEHNEHIIGTADYMAPEQAIDSHAVDHRADLYSLGCTLYFLLTGRLPFPDGALAQRLVAHQSANPAAIRTFRPDVPPELEKICAVLMAKKPKHRFQSAMELSEALARFQRSRQEDAESDTMCLSKSDTQIQRTVDIPLLQALRRQAAAHASDLPVAQLVGVRSNAPSANANPASSGMLNAVKLTRSRDQLSDFIATLRDPSQCSVVEKARQRARVKQEVFIVAGLIAVAVAAVVGVVLL